MFIKVVGTAKVTRVREGKTKDNTPVINIAVEAEMTTANGVKRTTKASLSGFDKIAETIRALMLREGDTVTFVGDPRAEIYTPRDAKEPHAYQAVSVQSITVVDRATLPNDNGGDAGHEAAPSTSIEPQASAPRVDQVPW